MLIFSPLLQSELNLGLLVYRMQKRHSQSNSRAVRSEIMLESFLPRRMHLFLKLGAHVNISQANVRKAMFLCWS